MTTTDMPSRIPAISIQQPWADLILRGEKRDELRNWAPHYRGKLWLHTGQKGARGFSHKNLFTGGYIGSIVLTAVTPLDSDLNRRFKFAWVITSPLRFREPIPGKGQRRLFFPPPEIEAQLMKAAYI